MSKLDARLCHASCYDRHVQHFQTSFWQLFYFDYFEYFRIRLARLSKQYRFMAHKAHVFYVHDRAVVFTANANWNNLPNSKSRTATLDLSNQ